MKYKSMIFRDAEAIARWLNKKQAVEIATTSTQPEGKIHIVYRDKAPTNSESQDDQDFLAGRASQLAANGQLTLARLTNSVRNLKRFKDTPLPELREYVKTKIASQYTLTPSKRGLLITDKP